MGSSNNKQNLKVSGIISFLLWFAKPILYSCKADIIYPKK